MAVHFFWAAVPPRQRTHRTNLLWNRIARQTERLAARHVAQESLQQLGVPFALRMDEEEPKSVPSKGWAGMIRKVYEVDPMVCPKCGGR